MPNNLWKNYTYTHAHFQHYNCPREILIILLIFLKHLAINRFLWQALTFPSVMFHEEKTKSQSSFFPCILLPYLCQILANRRSSSSRLLKVMSKTFSFLHCRCCKKKSKRFLLVQKKKISQNLSDSETHVPHPTPNLHIP